MGGDGVGVVTWLKDYQGNNLVINSDGSINIGTITASKISGQVIYIGEVGTTNIAQIDTENDDNSTRSTRGVVAIAHLKAYDEASTRMVRLRASAAISGQYKLMVTISGDKVYDMGTTIVTANWVSLSTASGGTQLPNQACLEVTVRSISGNAPIFLGGIGAHAPVSGKGQILYGGEARSYRVDNFNAIRAVATRAGDMLALDGYNS